MDPIGESGSSQVGRKGASALRRLIAAPAFLLIVAAQLGATGVIALTCFLAVASSNASLSAWVVASAVTVAAGGLSWLLSRWLWRGLGSSNVLVIASWLFAAATIVTSQFSFEVMREFARRSSQGHQESGTQLQPPAPTFPLAALEDRFGDCMRELAQPEPLRVAQQTARRIVGEDAEDVVQRTILAVCERHARSRIDSLVPYFVRSTENLAKHAFATRWNAEGCELEEIPCGWDTEEAMLRAQRLATVHEALCQLDPRQRIVIEGRLSGLTDDQIAERLDTTRENVRQLASRGTSEIRVRIALRESLCKQ